MPYKILPAVKGGEKGIYFFLKYVAKYTPVTCFSVSENAAHISGVEWEPVLSSTQKKIRYANLSLIGILKRICKKKEIQHIIVEHPYYAWLGIALKKWAGLQLIIHSHNIEAARFKSMGKWWWSIMYCYEKWAHRSADFSFFITEEDRAYATSTYGVNPEQCAVITYGIETAAAPSFEERALCKKKICEQLQISPENQIIFFNGALNYSPNRDGLDRILNQINPLLHAQMTTPYKIIICGMQLPEAYQGLEAYKNQHILYQGFVADIDVFFKAADLFINPIIDGGGIKTKLVEALGANTPSISFVSGAYGIPLSITGSHLTVVRDDDASAFAHAIVAALNSPADNIPSTFYQHFSWDAIARKAARCIENLR